MRLSENYSQLKNKIDRTYEKQHIQNITAYRFLDTSMKMNPVHGFYFSFLLIMILFCVKWFVLEKIRKS